MEPVNQSDDLWFDFDVKALEKNRQLVKEIITRKRKNFEQGLRLPFALKAVAPSRDQTTIANHTDDTTRDRKCSPSPNGKDRSPEKEMSLQKMEVPSILKSQLVNISEIQIPEGSRRVPRPPRITCPTTSLWFGKVHLELRLTKVEDVKGDVIIVAYNRQQGLRISPGEYLFRNETSYDLKKSISSRTIVSLGRLRDKKQIGNTVIQSEREWEMIGLRSSNPRFKTYLFLEIEKIADIYPRLKLALKAMFGEYYKCIPINNSAMVVCYLNNTNEPCETASSEMMECLVEELAIGHDSRDPIQITLVAETKEKYRSLDRVFHQFIVNDLKNGGIIAD